MIVWDNFAQLREMPWIPLFNPHSEGIDILIQEFEQADRLNDGLILPINIKGYFISGEGVGQTEPWLFEFNILELLVLQETQKVLTEASD